MPVYLLKCQGTLPRCLRGAQSVASVFGILGGKRVSCPEGKYQQGCTCRTFSSHFSLFLLCPGGSLDFSGRFLDAFSTSLCHLGPVTLEHSLEPCKWNCDSPSSHAPPGNVVQRLGCRTWHSASHVRCQYCACRVNWPMKRGGEKTHFCKYLYGKRKTAEPAGFLLAADLKGKSLQRMSMLVNFKKSFSW